MTHVLIVDDSLLNLSLAKDILQSSGYETSEIDCGEDLQGQLEKQVPDLVLMDIQLPGMSGFDCLKLMRSDNRYAAIPVIAFTASVMQEDKQAIMDAGFNSLIEKPIGFKDFLSTIASALQKSAS
ncbi:response regulator [Polynucleobacter sp. MG-5-Ahmo-C2]|jgi:two-component system cell cycle response regulator DivK|uniref:response regulator n=1 Tax=Polynucleobacter sp. MG-5-Ahmo-C2 TaxID=2081051 RepID=UPI001BFE936C|nr:response regulator [Polynucleobacter sp. MG-5-Ahmo-C2]QWD13678.1 response regulator [Polynucleobacter paneuropaeus]QWD97827.1 response regulator [Polynucleobacter sp. MG-5-Ahmo-C2]